MSLHESKTDYKNLIQDLAEMYPCDVAEVVVVELVANSLDARATCISISYDPKNKVLTVADNGNGMSAAQFEEYHDFAVGLKTRGEGIGFAGVGAKISFNIADRVITETRSKSFSGGSDWYFESNKRLVWQDIQPTHLTGKGTKVEVHFRHDARIAYATAEDLNKLLQRHYLPLLDIECLKLYEQLGCYSSNLRFIVNEKEVKPFNIESKFELDKLRKFFPNRAGKKIGYCVFGLATSEYPFEPGVCGVLLCTHGKVIKADLFNQFPASLGPMLFGVAEIPSFVNFLTTAKTDFIRGRGKHKEFERLYDPVRQGFKDWLEELGVESIEVTDDYEAKQLEKELKKLLSEVSELGEFFGFRTKKSVLQQTDTGEVLVSTHNGTEPTFPVGEGNGGEGPGPVDVGDQSGSTLEEDTQNGTGQAKPISRTGRKGPKISFASRPETSDLAWVDGNTVVINSGHPCYEKVSKVRLSKRLHCLFAIAVAVQRFIGGSDKAPNLMFIDRMMQAWGKKRV